MKNAPNRPSYTIGQNTRYILKNANAFAPSLKYSFLGYTFGRIVLSVMGVVTVKLILDAIQSGRPFATVMAWIVGIGTGTFVASALENYSWNSYWPLVVRVRFEFLTILGQKAMCMDYENTESPHMLAALQNAKAASSDNRKGVAGFLLKAAKICPAVLTCVFCGTVIAYIDLYILAGIAVIVLLNFLYAKRCKQSEYEKNREITGDLDRKREEIGTIMWNFRFGKEIRVYGLSAVIADTYHRVADRIQTLFQEMEHIGFRRLSVSGFLNFLLQMLLYFVLVLKVTGGAITISDFLMVAVTVRTFSEALLNVMELLTELLKINLELNDLRAFLELPDHLMESGQESVDEFESLEFRDVSFRYPGAERDALRHVSFKLEKREKIALVGYNGSGKTTIVKLMMRLYDPSAGVILLNGRDIRCFDLRKVQKLFSVMFQETQVYAFPLKENIALSENPDMEKVEAAVRMAGLWEKVSRLPDGFDTPVLRLIDDHGIELSGGEKQKMAFARAVYRDAPVVVLDEPTASLDAFSEERMFEQIEAFAEGKSGVFISHRLSSVGFCDRILLIEKGAVREAGSHGELMALGKQYYALYTEQTDLYRGGLQDEAVCQNL